MMLISSILMTALVAQLQAVTIQGKVVDDQGKPATYAQVIGFNPRPWTGTGEPVEAETTTDAGGRFHLVSRSARRPAFFRLWSYRPGSAIAFTSSNTPSFDLALRKPQPKVVQLEGPDGRPVPGARLSPLLLNIDGRGGRDEVPEALATRLSVTTGPDGQATLNYLASSDKLLSVRLTATSIGTQDLQIIENPRRNNQGVTIAIRLKPTRRLAGRVRNQAGKPVAGQEVEVWSKGGDWLRMNPVAFLDGPLRTSADGTFRTPENLLVGSSYQVVIRAPGFEPILSKWITIGEQPPLPLPMLQRPLRTIRGRVVDRQGKPLSDVEVFQLGDGPGRTATKTDSDGRFALGGFREGPVFLFARKDGYRFFGWLIKAGEDEVAVKMIRIGDRPAPELRTLPEPIPQEESRALALRLLEPCWEAAFARKDQDAAGRALISLAAADPVSALQKLDAEDIGISQIEGEDVASSSAASRIKMAAVVAIGRGDPARAEKVAESIGSLTLRSIALSVVSNALPASEHDHKLALLARATVHAKAAKAPFLVVGVAQRLVRLGETDKARALVAEYVGFAKNNREQRRILGLRLARIDPVAALSIAKEFTSSSRSDANRILWNVAIVLAADNPAEAERVLRLLPKEKGQAWLHPVIAGKMAARDPARARRLVDESQRLDDSPQTYLWLACGLKARDPAAAEEAFWKGIRGIDRLLAEGDDDLALRDRGGIATLLPLVEQIDPTLVPEVFWRAVAARPPIGNPRLSNDESLRDLVELLSWYDREVAAAVFEPVRDRMDQTDDRELATQRSEFMSWVLFNPRAAVARIEQLQLPATTELDTKAILALREFVGRNLARPYEEQWRFVWFTPGYGEMKALFEREFW